MQTLEVDLGDRSYPIHIGPGLLANPDLLTPHIHGKQVMIVSNETVAPLYLEQIKSACVNYQCDVVILPDGESFKTLESVNLIFDGLLKARHNRTTTLIALGGGVVGDITGFAAASYQRGVNFIQIPTTLLSQVDSSVGGKTGVNHALGKNMIGAFHQPQCVIADTETLNTLPLRELRAGFAEVIKYGLICDSEFFDWLEQNYQAILARDTEALIYTLERACQNKARVVSQDERESGIRAILNLGHTFGHAIETAQGYGNWLHGEAVAAGMVMAADLSARLGWISKADAERSRRLIESSGLPALPPEDMTSQRFMELMAVDKKVLDGALRLVLLKGIGDAVITSDFDTQALIETFAAGPALCG
jgi:3-dehydroquinate synthase